MSVYFRKFRAYLRKNETARGLFLVGLVILGAVVVWEGIRISLNTDYPILVVSSGSMCQKVIDPSTSECTLAIGDLIVIQGQTPGSIQVPPTSYSTLECPGVALNPVGTIIVFHKPTDPSDFLIVHRVYRAISISGVTYYDTKGDSNMCADGDQIGPSDIKGVYQYTIPIPYLGSTILAIRDFMYNSNTGQPNPQGILVIVALIVALFAFEVVQPSKTTTPPKAPDPAGPQTPSSPSASQGTTSAAEDSPQFVITLWHVQEVVDALSLT